MLPNMQIGTYVVEEILHTPNGINGQLVEDHEPFNNCTNQDFISGGQISDSNGIALQYLLRI